MLVIQISTLTKKISSIGPLAILMTLSYFPIFQNLGKFQIRMWDEATYANNSIDMLLNNNPMVVEHLGQPDLYNTKPPFVIWMQALSMKVLGINEFAIRLPSALAGLFTVFLVYFFCIRLLKSKMVGFIAAVILISTKGFISNHMVRTGDLDAFLVFWLTLGLFVFIDLVIHKPNKTVLHFVILSISFIGGFLTKGIAGFFFIPFMLIISLIYGNHVIFREKSLYLCAFVTLVICSGYYFIREFLTPGYLQLVLESEIFRFNTVVMSWHVHPFDYYFENLKSSRFRPFCFFLPMVLFVLFILRSRHFKVLAFLSITAVGYLLLISYPAVKLEWYDAPLFPLLSILTGLSFVEAGMYIFKKLSITRDNGNSRLVLFIVAILCLIKPYKDVLEIVKYPEEEIYSMDFDGAYLKYLRQHRPNLKKLTVYKIENHVEHYDQVLFYVRSYKINYGYNIKLTHEPEFKIGEVVVVCKPVNKEELSKLYKIKEIDSWYNGSTFVILGKVNEKCL